MTASPGSTAHWDSAYLSEVCEVGTDKITPASGKNPIETFQ